MTYGQHVQAQPFWLWSWASSGNIPTDLASVCGLLGLGGSTHSPALLKTHTWPTFEACDGSLLETAVPRRLQGHTGRPLSHFSQIPRADAAPTRRSAAVKRAWPSFNAPHRSHCRGDRKSNHSLGNEPSLTSYWGLDSELEGGLVSRRTSPSLAMSPLLSLSQRPRHGAHGCPVQTPCQIQGGDVGQQSPQDV